MTPPTFSALIVPKMKGEESFMRAKILLALDGSESSMKAARYVANLLRNQPDVSMGV